MVHARRAVFRHGMPRVREWAVWSLPRPLLALWSVVTCGYLAWIGARASDFHFRAAGHRAVRRAARLRRLLGGDGPPRQRADRRGEGRLRGLGAADRLPAPRPVRADRPGHAGSPSPSGGSGGRPPTGGSTPRRRSASPTAARALSSWPCCRRAASRAPTCGATPPMWLVAAGAGALTQWAINQALILGRRQAGEPGGQDQGRAARPGDAAQRRDRAVRRAARRRGHDDQRPHADRRAPARHAAAALLPARAAAQRGPGRREDRAAQRGDLGARGGGGGRPGGPHLTRRSRSPCSTWTGSSRSTTPTATWSGDEVLRADRRALMTSVLREYDLAGRFGGEEFVMLLPQTRAPDALRIAERVRAHIARLPIAAPGGERDPRHGLHRGRGA